MTTELERALARAAHRPELLAPDHTGRVDPLRLSANRHVIEAELDAPRPGGLARVLARLGVGEAVLPLVTATPALRRSWGISVAVAVLFALSAASNSSADGVERIVVFLTIAPLVPLLGVALSFGRGVDPTHDLVIAAPLDAVRVYLIRAVTVVSTSTVVLLAASVVVPSGGATRVAWLVPALATTSLSMVLSTRLEPRTAAGVVAAGWLAAVMLVTNVTSAAAMFGPVTQLASAVAVAVSLVALVVRRDRLEVVERELGR